MRLLLAVEKVVDVVLSNGRASGRSMAVTVAAAVGLREVGEGRL